MKSSSSQKKIKDVPNIIAVVFDMWSDQYSKVPYIDISIQYYDKNFEKHNFNLALDCFEHPHTAQTIKDKIEAVLKFFQIRAKIITVTDNAANVKRAGIIMENCLDQHFCVDHVLHLLLMHDILIKGHFESIKNIINKIKSSHHKLINKNRDLRQEFENNKSLQFSEKLLECLSEGEHSFKF
jgi:hypothetical protein